MYRILEEHDEVQERRRQRRHPKRVKPELRTTGPRQIWSWDITQLKGPGCFYYLYKIIDVFSRYVVGWMIATRESGELAEKLIGETCVKQGIEQDQLILHADRGSAMRSKTVKDLLKDLGVQKSYSRPYTPTDNPYSESEFKTMKYRPDYPEEFSGITHSRRWMRAFVQWYNNEHHHNGLALMTPATVHYGQVENVRTQRQSVLDAAYAAHPERFVGGKPTPPELPKEVWINQPKKSHDDNTHFAGPAVSDREPGAQAGSRAKSEASLDAAEHLAIVEPPLVPAHETSIFLPKFEPELCQSCWHIPLQEILRVEPRLWSVVNDAATQRRSRTYHRIRTYLALRNRVIPLVGWHAEREELRTSDHYQIVIDTIVDLLPPDEADLWPEGRPEV
jgi:putative transposase